MTLLRRLRLATVFRSGGACRAQRLRGSRSTLTSSTFNKGGNRIDKLQVINRGTETAYDVTLTVPEKAGIDLRSTGLPVTPNVPGGGRSVTIDVMTSRMVLGAAGMDRAFDVTIAACIDGGEQHTQDMFLDMNG